MKIAIVGSRDYKNLDKVENYILQLDPANDVVISGGARGVDKVAELSAKQRGIPTVIFEANWKEFGRSAGFRRNADIVKAADSIVAFWDGSSRGTQHTVDLARKAGKLVVIYSDS